MSVRLASLLAVSMFVASAAISTTAAAQQFDPTGWYVGPRVSVGNLNNATAVGAVLERGITKPGTAGPGSISGGIALDYYTYSHGYAAGYSYRYSVTPVQIFAAYHYPIQSVPKLDPFAGVGAVYSIYSSTFRSPNGTTTTTTSPNANSSSVAAFVGARYFLSNFFAVNAQAGFGYTNLSIGVSFGF